jgi:uncharacterized SAM-binding protein YcdF (DUF218 family)
VASLPNQPNQPISLGLVGRGYRFFIMLALLTPVFISVAALCILAYGAADRTTSSTRADVIVVLGAGTRANGTPSASHRRRINHAWALYKQGMAPLLLCTGGYTQRHPKSEADVCKEMLVSLGVPASAILSEEISTSTAENAIQARQVMLANNLANAILVSDNFHLWRAELLFTGQGIPVVISPAQATTGPVYWRTVMLNCYREVAATLWHVGQRLLGR